MSIEPPLFQEASRCDVCKCSFSTFRRRHHCRCCGRTLCAEHSSNQMALPQFGIHINVRVCADCFNVGSRVDKDGETATPNTVNTITDSMSRTDIGTVSDSKSEVSPLESHLLGVKDCKCGMPLCICESPKPQKDTITTQPITTVSTPSLNSTPKLRNTQPTSKNRGSTSNSKQSNLFNPSQVVNNSTDRSDINYEVTGEGLREAIKNGDTAAAKRLLSQGVDANYCDKQGSSLLHLAAVFNQTEIAFYLMDHGASVDRKNSLGESPLDCAPATLQYKMKKKMEENMQLDS